MLNREPMGMKRYEARRLRQTAQVSVLNREPMGMKHNKMPRTYEHRYGFSAQPRADGDEAFRVGSIQR